MGENAIAERRLMTKEVKVTPTALDVLFGVQLDGSSCAIAKAVKRDTGLKHVRVGGSIRVGRGPGREVVETFVPDEALDWILAFDAASPGKKLRMAFGKKPSIAVRVPR